MTTTSDVVFPPAPRTSISQRLLRRAGRIYSSVAVAVTGRRKQTLHHELAWRPVVVSLVIVLLGSSATSAWMAYQSVRDRKKLIQSFAQFARNDLETNLRQVFAEVQDIAGRWEGFLTLTDDPTAQKSLSRFLEPAILHKSAGNWYDVLLFLQTDGTIFKAVSGARHPARKSRRTSLFIRARVVRGRGDSPGRVDARPDRRDPGSPVA